MTIILTVLATVAVHVLAFFAFRSWLRSRPIHVNAAAFGTVADAEPGPRGIVKVRMVPLGFPTTLMKRRGERASIATRPLQDFKITRLVIPSDIGDTLLVEDLLVNGVSLLTQPVPASMFSETGTGLDPFEHTCPADTEIEVKVVFKGLSLLQSLKMRRWGQKLLRAL